MFFQTTVAATLISAVAAHQNFHQFWVNGVSPGYQVSIRMPPSNSPVTNVSSTDITCNVNGNKVPSGVTTTPAKEGDEITVQWDSSGHPGPIQHYLMGPVDDASQTTGIGSWFKIQEWAQTNGTWASAIMEAGNMSMSFKLPTGLATGEYLLRSEMLALHSSQTIDGAQWYIGCAQLSITGTAAETCSPSIELPGAYNDTDPSIYIPDFYYGFDISTYTPPGGPVATCGAGSGSAATTAATTAAAAATTAVAASSAVASSSVIVSSAVASSTQAAVVASSALSTAVAAPTTFITATSAAAAASSAVAVPDDECEA
ncbi:hypothetical protein ACMFMG_000312 [Clarireedia jacksonii]